MNRAGVGAEGREAVEMWRRGDPGSNNQLIYADGSCWPTNPGIMGVGIFIRDGAAQRQYSYSAGPGTSARAELVALLKAISIANNGAQIFSDSKYAIGVAAQGWKAKANLDLVERLRAALKKKRISLNWVRGHSGNPYHNQADRLAREGSAAGVDYIVDVGHAEIDAGFNSAIARDGA